ncbi:SdpI family protein [Portibacter marinus]|uniref:SdpI family protein n=1 Tax=Portibacter marinus TaxID=2898660 RepID=UPI001F194F3B|nr:SdpI family protein [Portibacter marinus]
MSMLSFSNPLFIVLLTTGVSVWLIGIYVLKNPPKKINKLYGYRTPRAMRSQQAWDYAQIAGTRRMIFGAMMLCLLSIGGLFISFGEIVDSLLAIGMIIIVLMWSLYKTEVELREKFP